MVKSKLGWIGCGNMGRPIVTHLLKANHEVFINDVVKNNAKELISNGAIWCESPQIVANKADYIFTMVPNGKILQIVNLGPSGLISGLSEGKIVIDMSTISPSESSVVSKGIEEMKCEFLRSPVTGSTSLAEQAALGVFVSGQPEAFEKVLPFYQAFTNKQYYLGQGEQSRILKLAINIMVAVNMQMLAEAMVLIDKGGLDRAQALEIIANSAAGSPVIQYKAANILKKEYPAAFSVEMMEKDLDLALEVAKEYNIGVPVTAITRQFLAMAHSTGRKEKDFSVLVEFLEELSCKC